MLYVMPVELLQADRGGFRPDDIALQKKALQELDHYFAFLLFREMRKAVPANDLFGRGIQREFFEEALDDALSAEIAKTGQLGVAKQVEDQLRIGKLRNAAEDPRRIHRRQPAGPVA